MTSLALEGLKAKQQNIWSSGDYGSVAAMIHPMSEALVQGANLSAGSRVLDVATGTGNAALAAARCRCDVTGVDYVNALMDRGRARAEAEGLPVTFTEADAEALPFGDAEFDAVFSVVGVMFAPDQETTAAELARVCRPGGTIAVANWTPEGFIGQLLKTVSRHVPPPPGVRPGVLWGTEDRLREIFGDTITDLRTVSRDFVFRFTSAEEFAEFFKEYYGPTLKAFEAAGKSEGGDKALFDDLVELINRHNVAEDGTVKVPSAYLEAYAYRA